MVMWELIFTVCMSSSLAEPHYKPAEKCSLWNLGLHLSSAQFAAAFECFSGLWMRVGLI